MLYAVARTDGARCAGARHDVEDTHEERAHGGLRHFEGTLARKRDHPARRRHRHPAPGDRSAHGPLVLGRDRQSHPPQHRAQDARGLHPRRGRRHHHEHLLFGATQLRVGGTERSGDRAQHSRGGPGAGSAGPERGPADLHRRVGLQLRRLDRGPVPATHAQVPPRAASGTSSTQPHHRGAGTAQPRRTGGNPRRRGGGLPDRGGDR